MNEDTEWRELGGESPDGGYPVLPGAESFFLPGGPTGVLLLHGFTSSPAEIRPLGGFLAEQGYTVYSPRLAGHGTTPEHLRTTSWQDWVDSARAGLPVLAAAGCTQVALVGLSLGGSISLYLATQRPNDYLSVVTINSPVFIPTILQPALHWLGGGPIPFFDKGITDLPATEPGRHSLTYSRTPLESVSVLIAFLNQVNTALARIITPTMVVYSRKDRLVPSFNAMRIYSTISSIDKHLMVIHGARHVLTVGPDAPRTFAAIGAFLGHHAPHSTQAAS